MRTRLAIILFVPCVLVLVLLGAAYSGNVARANQQEVYLDRLADAGYLVITARQSLTSDDPAIVAGDLQRYRDVYGVGATVLDQSGAVWATNGLDVEDVDERRAALAGRRGEAVLSTLPWKADRVVVAEPVYDGGDLVGAVVTVSEASSISRSIWSSWGILVAAGLAMCVLAVAVAHRTAGWVLRPVRAVDAAMGEIGRGRLDARIPPATGPPELRAVVSRFNAMAAQVEHSMRRQQEFASNASHELRNPLNALMLRVEDLALSTPPGHATEVAHVRAEAVRMAHILDALLLLADDANLAAAAHPVDVAELVGRRVESWRLIAVGRHLAFDAVPDGAWAELNEIVLECAFDAVLDNAVKFSPDGGRIDVTVAVRPDGADDADDTDGADGAAGTVEVTVRDHGAGVPPDELERLAERFWRSPGHSTVRGSGLGLAIASELLATGGGSLRLALPDGGGFEVRLRMPARAAAVVS
ncbi:ATP-binding protein [Isoptericola sp. NPDC055881]